MADDSRLEEMLQIEQLCHRFEQSWQSGEPPDLREFLNGASPTIKKRAFAELLHLDLQYRQQRNMTRAINEYVAEFPADGPLVASICEEFHSASSTAVGASSAAVGSAETRHEPDAADADGDVPGERYQRREMLGQGAFCEVYLGFDQKLHREVAIKVPRRQKWDHDTKRFLAEARIAAAFDHPNIVSIYDVQEYRNRPFIVMRYVSGGTLASRLHDGHLAEHETVKLVSQIADALDYAHSKGLIHRDLKPANILMDGDKPLVADFGLAIDDRWQRQQLGQLAGSLPYMAPEQAEPKGEIDSRADLWALGVILYEALAGQRPFNGESEEELKAHILASPPSDTMPNVSLRVKAVCLRALEKDRDRRFSNAAEMASALRKAIAPRFSWSAVAASLLLLVAVGLLLLVTIQNIRINRMVDALSTMEAPAAAEVIGQIDDTTRSKLIDQFEQKLNDQTGAIDWVKAAVVLLKLEPANDLPWTMMAQANEDAKERRRAFYALPHDYGLDIRVVAARLDVDDAVLPTVLMALAEYDRSQLSDEQLGAITSKLSQLAKHGNRTVQLAVALLCKRWGIAPPSEPSGLLHKDSEKASPPAK